MTGAAAPSLCARWACALLASLLLGCASDLIVAAPEVLPPVETASLAALPPLQVTVSAVANAPPMTASVGERGAAALQPGGPIHLTEDSATIVRRAVIQTFQRSGHQVVASDGAAHVSLRLDELTVTAPREGVGWLVTVRVRLALRVSARPGDESWDQLSVSAERTLRTAWRPGVGTVEPVLRGCLEDLGALLADRKELAAALARHGSQQAGG